MTWEQQSAEDEEDQLSGPPCLERTEAAVSPASPALSSWKIPELRRSSREVVRVSQEDLKLGCVLLVGLLFHRLDTMGKL